MEEKLEQNINSGLISDRISTFSILKDAWKVTKVKGVKSSIISATIKSNFLAYLTAITIILGSLFLSFIAFPNLEFVEKPSTTYPGNGNPFSFFTSLFITLSSFFVLPLIWNRSINVIRTREVNYKRLFRSIKNPFTYFISYLVTIMIQSLMPIALIFIFGFAIQYIIKPNLDQNTIYMLTTTLSLIFSSLLSILILYTNLIVLNKNCKGIKEIFRSMLLSASHVFRHYFTYIGLVIVALIISILSLCTLCIGFLWTYPLLVNLYAVAYEKEKF